MRTIDWRAYLESSEYIWFVMNERTTAKRKVRCSRVNIMENGWSKEKMLECVGDADVDNRRKFSP